MPVQYNSQKIIPAPWVSFDKQYQRTADGELIGVIWDVMVHGKLLATKGSPQSSGNFWNLGGYPPDEVIDDTKMLKSLLTKQEALRQLFATQGQSFEVQPLDGSMPIKLSPRILRINFPEGNWYNESEYTVEMQADFIEGLINPSGEDSFSQYLSEANESWQLEFNDQPENAQQHQTFRLSHNVAAVGKLHYDAGQTTVDAWVQARNWVLPHLGIDMSRIIGSGSINLPTYMSGYNQVRSEIVDKKGGSYSVSESWLIASGIALEDFTVNMQNSVDDGLVHVSIDGQIQGLEIRDSQYQIVQSKWDSANAQFSGIANTIYTRAQNYSHVNNLHVAPFNQVVASNPVAGTIHYTYDFNTRPPNFFANSKFEMVTINDHNPQDIFAAIPILGRANGPLLQDIGTKGEAIRSLTIEVTMPPASSNIFSDWINLKPDTSTMLTAAAPVASRVFKSQDEETWIPQNGHYTRQVAWTWGN